MTRTTRREATAVATKAIKEMPNNFGNRDGASLRTDNYFRMRMADWAIDAIDWDSLEAKKIIPRVSH